MTDSTLRVCNTCDSVKPGHEFNKKTDSTQPGVIRFQAQCMPCEKKRRNAKHRYCTFKMPGGGVEDWVRFCHRKGYLDKGGTIIDIWFQNCPGDKRPSRKELLTGIFPKANNAITKLNRQVALPKILRSRVIPSPKMVITSTPRWQDAATSKAIRWNLMIRHKVCEFTGIPEQFCHESHILSRRLCREWGHPEWVGVEENAIFIFGGLNIAMDRDYWLDPNGSFMPPLGQEHDEWMVKLGIPNTRIDMYGKRNWFAMMAAVGMELPDVIESRKQ